MTPHSSSLRSAIVCVAATVMTLLASTSTAFGQGPPYTFSKISYPGAVSTDVGGINNAGKVVGTYFLADGTVHGFLYDSATYTTIDFPGAPYTYLFGINASDQIVGSYSTSTSIGPYHGLIVDSGTHTTFDYPTQETDGRAINASGHIVGIYDAAFGNPDHGYLKVGDTYTSIDVAGTLHTYAFGINDAGKITGTYVDGSGQLHGWIRTAGAFTFVNFPGATQTVIGGINNSDVMVGWTDQATKRRGFVLTGTGFTAFDADFPGVVATMPMAINDSGQIVGEYVGLDCPSGCPFIGTPNPGGTATCGQSISLGYGANTLTYGFTLKTSTPLIWDVWLLALNTPIRVWTFPLPAISPAVSFSYPITGFPPVGPVVGMSMLSTAAGDAMCINFAVTNAATGNVTTTSSRD